MTISEPSYLEAARERLLSRVTVTGGCWLWTGAKGHGGYGKMYFMQHFVDTHRVSWILTHGPIPEGMVIAHSCDAPACVNPEHLFLTTQAGNLADMREKARGSQGAEHSAALRAAWTPELRAAHSRQSREWQAARRTDARRTAGVPDDWKRCAVCGEWKTPDAFHKRRRAADGLRSECRSCRSTFGC